MSEDKLVKSSVYYTIGNILPQAASFLLLPIYLKYLDPSEYGIVSSMTVLSAVISIIFTMGLERGIYRLYYDYDLEERKVFLGTVIIGMFSSGLILTTLFLLFPAILSQVYTSIPFYPYYLLMVLFTFFSKIISVPLIYFQVSEQALKYLILSIATFFLTASLILLFIVKYNEGAVGMLKGYLIANVIMVPIYFFAAKKAFVFKFNFDYFKNSMSFSLPLIPAVASAWVLNLSDRVFLERYLSLSAVGIYSLGYKIASLIGIFVGGIYMAYNPYFYKTANENTGEVKNKIYKSNNIFIILVLIISFIIPFFSKEVITLFFPIKYQNAASIIPIVVLGIFFTQIGGLLNLMIYQEKKTLQIMYLYLVAALLNIVFNFLLIPKFGMFGAAYATLISFVLLFVIEYQYAKKCYFIPFNWKMITIVSSFLIFIYFITNIISNYYIIVGLSIKILLTILLIIIIYVRYNKQIKVLILKK